MAEETNINNEVSKESPSEKSPEILKLEADLDKAVREREEYLNGWKRAKADFINYKKDELSRMQEMVKFSSEDVVRDIVPVLDSFELGLASLEKAGPIEKGVYMIKGQLEDVLKRRGLEKIKVVPGDAFDPEYHESVGTVEMKSDGGTAYDSGKIAEEVEAGYMFQGKMLRPSRVRLVK